MTNSSFISRRLIPRAASLSLALLLLAVSAGCRAKPTPQRSLDASVVANADLFCRIDAKAIADSPIGRKLTELKDKNKKTAADAIPVAEMGNRIESATGLKSGDMASIWISAVIGDIDLQNAAGTPDTSKLSLVAAVLLTKPTTLDQLKATASSAADDGTKAEVAEMMLAGKRVVRVKPADPQAPPAYFTLGDDNTVILLALNEPSLTGAIERAAAGKAERPPALQAAVQQTNASQVQAVFVPSDAVRAKFKQALKDRQKGGNAGAGMIAGALKPFENLKQATLVGSFSDVASFRLATELGSPDDAAQLSALLNGLIIPLLQGGGIQGGTNPLGGLGDSLTVKNEGASLVLSISLTEKDLLSSPATDAAVVEQP